MTEQQTMEAVAETPKRKGWPKGKPRKKAEPEVEPGTAVRVASPETAPVEQDRPLGHYDRKAAHSGAIVYQVVAHTRDAVRILGPKGSLVAMLYRRSPVPGTNGEVMDHPFADVAARDLCEFLNGKAGELR